MRSFGNSALLVTALSPVIGYDKASTIAHLAEDKGTTLRDAAIQSGDVSGAQFDKVVMPDHMVGNPRQDLGLPPGAN